MPDRLPALLAPILLRQDPAVWHLPGNGHNAPPIGSHDRVGASADLRCGGSDRRLYRSGDRQAVCPVLPAFL
ncbi:hypothetical protein D3C75_1110290 [compost metagenome]